MTLSRCCLSAAMLMLAACCCIAQPIITSILPNAADAGDTITITGTSLGSVTHARFFADTGGFAGPIFSIVVPASVSANQVKVVVPSFGFVGPAAFPPSSPFGTVELRDSGGLFSSAETFYYLQDPGSGGSSTGLGSTNSLGCRAAACFDLPGGPPAPGNNTFTLTLDNAPPNEVAFLAVGSPDASPSIAVGDGLVAIDVLQPFTILMVPIPTGASGRITLPAPLPAPALGVQVTVMWGYTDGPAVQISNGLTASI